MALIELTLYNTHFILKLNNPNLKSIIDYACNRLVSYSYQYNKKIRRLTKIKDKNYFVYDNIRREYRFSIGVLRDVLLLLGNNNIKREHIDLFKPKLDYVKEIDINFNKKYTLREQQNLYVNAVLNNGSESGLNIALIDAQSGFGKSLLSSFLLSHYRKKFIIVVLAKYLDKWVTDIQEYTDIKSEDIYIIQGLDSIKTLSKTKSSDLKYKCYIVSLTTTTYYFKRYEDCTLDTDIISPPKLMEHLGVGIMYNDETHQAFHAVYKCVLYFTVDKLIATSATLISNKSDESRLYKTLFPNDTRVSGLVKKSNHVNVKAISYALTNNKKVQHKSSQGYSHIIYEQFITRHSMFLRNYIEMIVYYFKEGYIDKRREGDRALLYFSTVRMCHIIANTLKEYYPNLKIGTYVETDSYEDLMNNDVSVSTLISASTAVDIKNLIFVLNTISVSSAKSNLQSLGRLRNIEGRDLWYYYTYCVDIPSQIRLHKERESTIYSSTRMYLYERYRIPIRVR